MMDKSITDHSPNDQLRHTLYLEVPDDTVS